MLKFFRRIRQNLLAENKFSKYLLYAIGEIFLVVVGILIALQINNWNENSKNKELQIKYLHGLISDLDYDIRAFTVGVNELDDHRKSADALLTCYKNKTSLSDEELIDHLTNLSLITQFRHRNTVMDDMKSAGRLNLILSDSTRQAVIAYYKLADGIIESNDSNNNWILTNILGSRIYTEQFDLNAIVAESNNIPQVMKSVQVISFKGLPLLNDLDHPDRDNIINLLSAKNYLEGLNLYYGTQGRDGAIALKSLLEDYLEELEPKE